jgi:hypothetical protein
MKMNEQEIIDKVNKFLIENNLCITSDYEYDGGKGFYIKSLIDEDIRIDFEQFDI